jgi:3-oxoacyl-[acyl-carrier protein] reductase
VTDPGSRGALAGRVAIVTGANHGIGAATAVALAARGAAVLVTYLRVEDEPDPGTPEAYRVNRARDASAVLAAIAEAGGAGRSSSSIRPNGSSDQWMSW